MAGTPKSGRRPTRSPSGASHCMCCWAVRNPSLSPRRSGVLPKTWGRSRFCRSCCLPACACSPNSASARRSDVSRRWPGAWAPAISQRVSLPPYPGGELGSLMTVLNAYRLVARTPASRHRGAQSKTAAGAGAGGPREATARRRREQYGAGPDPLRCLGTRRDLQPAIHENDGHVAPGRQARLYLPRGDRPSRGNRLARHRRRGISCDLPPQHRCRAPYADRIDHVGWAFDPGRRPGDRERRLGCHGGGHYRAPARRGPVLRTWRITMR